MGYANGLHIRGAIWILPEAVNLKVKGQRGKGEGQGYRQSRGGAAVRIDLRDERGDEARDATSQKRWRHARLRVRVKGQGWGWGSGQG